jgi:transcriptional regulator with XRE-family HTH domain
MSELHVKIGKLLKLERQRQGIALDDLSTELKISVGNLEHVEAGNLDTLPSELYFNLFAKSYAEALGINYAATVEAIKEDIGQPLEPEGSAKKGMPDDVTEAAAAPGREEAPSGAEPKGGANFPRNFAIFFGALIVLFLIFVLVNKLLLGGDNSESVLDTPTDAASADISTEKQPATDEAQFAAYDWNVPQYQKPSDLQLKLVARQESWATVLADGDTAIFRTLTPGKVYMVSARYRLLVSVAMPSVVDIELNGRPVDLRNPATRRISRVAINQVNLDSFLNPLEPGADMPGKPRTSAADSVAPVQTGPRQNSNLGAENNGGLDMDKRSTDSTGTNESGDHEP